MAREKIARALKTSREKSGLTCEDVGKLIGKSPKTVNAWENNRGQPDADTFMLLCKIYSVKDIMTLFGESSHNSLNDNDVVITVDGTEQSLIKKYHALGDYGNKIKELRIKKGLTQAQLGEILGRSDSTVTVWEKGTSSPDVQTVAKMLEIFDITANEFFGYGEWKCQESSIFVNNEELHTIHKLRALDSHGKKNVDSIINNEYERCMENKKGVQPAKIDDTKPILGKYDVELSADEEAKIEAEGEAYKKELRLEANARKSDSYARKESGKISKKNKNAG